MNADCSKSDMGPPKPTPNGPMPLTPARPGGMAAWALLNHGGRPTPAIPAKLAAMLETVGAIAAAAAAVC